VKSVKNNIKIEPADTAAANDRNSDKSRTADNRRSGSSQPVRDTTITTKVKAKFLEDKAVSGTNIHVKTVNGVVRLTGSAKSNDESTKATELAREVEGVKSVTNKVKVM
jgi:osmotically-inducible protein OsmY